MVPVRHKNPPLSLFFSTKRKFPLPLRSFGPRKAPYFPKREKVAGRQTVPTPSVRKFAQKYPATLEGIHRAAQAILSFEKINANKNEAILTYAQRTAEDLFATRRIITFDFGVKSNRKARTASSLRSTGCAEQCLAFCAFLRAKRIKPLFVRFGTHSLVRFPLDGKPYFAEFSFDDTREKDELRFGPYDRELLRVADAKKRGAYAEGRDLWDIGIRSFSDFDKYPDKRLER